MYSFFEVFCGVPAEGVEYRGECHPIEHIFYKLVTIYKHELPDTVLDGHAWQPGDITTCSSRSTPT